MTQTRSGSQEKPKNVHHQAVSVAFWVSASIIILSVLSCVFIAITRSEGLTQVIVTALDENREPRDHNIPFVFRKESLPDYEIIVLKHNGTKQHLGAMRDKSAISGLTWNLNDPICTKEIATVRLQDQDKIFSDALVEVQFNGNTVNEDNYSFQFVTERSFTVGVNAFFSTPIGNAIAAGFCIAVLVIIISAFAI